jgi:hypothetical protein
MKSVNAGKIRLALLLLGLSFGYVEAAVVVYLRALSEPVRQRLLPQTSATELFPLLDLGELRAQAPQTARLIPIEIVREAATILILASAAAITGRKLWLPSFALLFGMWDATFYMFLKVLIDWPSSLFTWDLLFLVPVPWSAPVLAPLLVSGALMGCGWVAMGREVTLRATHWVCMIAGNLAILASFTLQWRALLGGAMPRGFAWPLFLGGLVLAVAAFGHASGAGRGRRRVGTA